MKGEPLLAESLASPQCIISVMGDHAGESPDEIFQRKMIDIERVGRTFWLIKSRKSKPESVARLCKENQAYVIFVSASAPGGARPTKTDNRASEYSVDRMMWYGLPAELSPVTGKLDTQSHALVFDALTTIRNGSMDIWSYADFEVPEKPVKIMLGCSTVCAIRKDMREHPERMKSRYRNVVAVARITPPFSVWVR